MAYHTWQDCQTIIDEDGEEDNDQKGSYEMTKIEHRMKVRSAENLLY